MDITPELINTVGKDGFLTIAVVYLWSRIISVTDAYLANVKEMAKIVQDNTVSTVNYTNAMNSLRESIEKLLEVKK